MKNIWLILVLTFACISTAFAQNPYDFNLLPFKMSADPHGLIYSESARKLHHLQWFAGGMFSYAYDPLTVALNGEKIGSIVEHQVAFDLSVGVGIWKYFQLGANLQAVLWQTGDDPGELGYPGAGELKAQALSDLRILPKVVFLPNSSRLGLALLPIVQLPTATSNAAAGEAGLMFEPRLIADYRLGANTWFVIQAGYRMRKPVEVENYLLDDEIVYAAGAEVGIAKGVSFVGEVFGAVGLNDAENDTDSSIDREEAPAEALLAARWRLANGLILTGGAGGGLNAGGSAAKLRAFVAVGFSPPVSTEPVVKDTDGDGILDPDDKCVNEPEDKNNFEDEDGCPDGTRDTDADGIPDMSDKCVNEPEDKNNFEDEDGCPDGTRDTDADGIPDMSDKCVNESEDKDNFADEDGCPDPDNDEDGFCDDHEVIQKNIATFASVCTGVDKCSNEKETINGFEDEDGCPDKGPVKAVITRTNIQILDKIYFNTGKTTLKKESFPVLDMVVSILKTHTHIQLLEIDGHTDDVGNDDDNLKLSDGRAAEVMKYLISKGIDANRLRSKGFGETAPVTDCKPLKGKALKACRATNRRVEFKILNQ